VKVYRVVERYWRKMLCSRSWAGRRRRASAARSAATSRAAPELQADIVAEVSHETWSNVLWSVLRLGEAQKLTD
jgi:hypothetical protein